MFYKLSCNLVGHELDVRNVTTSPDGGIITVSRDKSCRVWTNEEGSVGYVQSNVFYGHLGYVSSVCFMQPSEKHPQGTFYLIPCTAQMLKFMLFFKSHWDIVNDLGSLGGQF